MNLLTIANMLSRLYHGRGLTYEELTQLEIGLKEQLNWISQLREKMGRAHKDR